MLMPQSIVSDRDPRMTNLFWKALFENMGTTPKFSSSFHPRTDGQSEEANSTVMDLLKCYVSKHKATWEHYLLLVKYAYNNTVHTSTGKAPFEIVEGGKKFPPILHTKDKIFEGDKYVQNTNEAYKKIKLALEKTQSKQKKAIDCHRRELVFSLGDWVLLRFEKARLGKMKGKERLFPKLEDMVPEEQPEVEELDEILVPDVTDLDTPSRKSSTKHQRYPLQDSSQFIVHTQKRRHWHGGVPCPDDWPQRLAPP
ncbi:hypothetical protein L7F22_014832 [Adiantum nelumboides]|nr:hypothetical protein [Adiantum nelumboides]